MCDRDEMHRLAVGAGSPSDPDPLADGPPPSDEVMQAVVDLLDDVVEAVDDGDHS